MAGPLLCPAKESIHLSGEWAAAPLSKSEMAWWVMPSQGGDWKALNQYIKEGPARTCTLNSSAVTNTDPEPQPVAYTIHNPGHGYSISVNQTKWAAHQTTDKKGPKNITIMMWLCTHGFLWVTLDGGHLSTSATLCWVQKNHPKNNQPNCTKEMGWVSLELCGPLVTLKACDWFGTDRSHQPHTYRVAPSLWHKALAVSSICGWAAAPWVFLSPGRIHPTATKIINLPLLKATWVHSVYWQVHLAPSLSPPLVWRVS